MQKTEHPGSLGRILDIPLWSSKPSICRHYFLAELCEEIYSNYFWLGFLHCKGLIIVSSSYKKLRSGVSMCLRCGGSSAEEASWRWSWLTLTAGKELWRKCTALADAPVPFSVTFISTDTEPPRIQCPSVKEKTAEPNKLTARVFWDTPEGRDTADGILTE